MLLDAGASATERLSLNFGASRFRFAAPAGSDLTVEKLEGLRLATSYPGLVGAYLAERGVSVRLIRLDGAVETAIRLGVADVIADVVETGTTLRQAGLELFGDAILQSEAILITRTGVAPPAGFDQFVRRLNGVLVARNYVMMDYDVSSERIDEACAITPGLESPTVSPLAKDGWHAVRAMVPRQAGAADHGRPLGDRGPSDSRHGHRGMSDLCPSQPPSSIGPACCDWWRWWRRRRCCCCRSSVGSRCRRACGRSSCRPRSSRC